MELNTTFEISTRLLNPVFYIIPSGPIYLFPVELEFKIALLLGSNAKISMNMDSSALVSQLDNVFINITTNGSWSKNTVKQVSI